MIDTAAERPIGYWLKTLDRLIDGQFESRLGDAGLSRRQWQILNLLHDGARSMPELQDELEPFLQDAPDELDDAVTGLLSRGWADSQNAVISLSETGEAQFGLVTANIAELRQDLAAGISPEEYRATDRRPGSDGRKSRGKCEIRLSGWFETDQEPRSQSRGAATSLTAMGHHHDFRRHDEHGHEDGPAVGCVACCR